MPGTIVKPVRPGTVIKFVGQTVPRVLPSIADIVAVPLVHDWGPIYSDAGGADGSAGGFQLVSDLQTFDGLFGDSDTEGRRAVMMALDGQGTAGPGAGSVLVARMAAASAALATVTIQNTTPAAALRLDGKYKGARGNLVSYTKGTDPNVAGNDLLRLYLDGADSGERYSYPAADLASLAAQINLSSHLVTATVLVDGVALTNTGAAPGVSLAGGDSGLALTAADWTNVLAGLESQRFTILAPYDLTDAPTIASIVAWVQGRSDADQPIEYLSGGDAGDTIATAVARAAAANDPHVLTLGVGTYHDDLVGQDLTTSQLVPRIAGILAARGEDRSLTFAKLPMLHAVGTSAPPDASIQTAIQNGVTVLSASVSADADLKIEKGLTTWTSTNDPSRPLAIFSDPRLVRIMDLYVRAMKEWGDDNVIGSGAVNQDLRDAVRSKGRALQDDLEARGLVVPGTSFINVQNTDNDPTLSDSIPYDFGWQFAKTALYVFGNGRIS